MNEKVKEGGRNRREGLGGEVLKVQSVWCGLSTSSKRAVCAESLISQCGIKSMEDLRGGA